MGLGSKIPTSDDCIVVNLENLNKIREVNTQYHYAIVEPGVTQQQLVDYINERGLPLHLNVTGSSPHSSIVGNILEKGTGFRNHRIDDLRGLEVVLGNGKTIWTGFWDQHSDKRTVHHFKYGLGPYLDGLFMQSNYGITTAMVVNLIPTREDIWMLSCEVLEHNLEHFFNKVNHLYRNHYFSSSMHVGNLQRTRIVNDGLPEDTPKWLAWTTISGDKPLLDFLAREITSRLGESCKKLNIFTSEELNDQNSDPFLREMYLLHNGQPSYLFLRAMQESMGDLGSFDPDNIDKGRYGMLCCLPIIPFGGPEITQVKDLTYKVCMELGYMPAITFNPMNDLYVEAVINLYFDRGNRDEVKKAHKCNRLLHNALYNEGFRFYRMDVKNMKDYVDEDSTFWQTVEDIKHSLDPAGIIAPKRYNLS